MLLITVLFSCSRPTGIKEMIVNSDSVAINYFKGDGTADTVTNMIMLRDKGQIGKLANYVEATTTANYKCGYDGSIHLFKNNIAVKNIDFSFNDTKCMHFSFSIEGKIFNTQLSEEALQFIRLLNKK